ncbi:DUF3552 domain-containing protein, partial [Candidatus Babeliales bacterium]|nr:DUF3552 domain-containing protein [Candidatus Babeliales bacterium]
MYWSYLLGIVGFGIGFASAYWMRSKIILQRSKAKEEEALRVLEDAKRRSKALLREAQVEAKDRLLTMKSEFDAETNETRSELKKQENRRIQKEEGLDKKNDQLEKKDRELSKKEKQLQKK